MRVNSTLDKPLIVVGAGRSGTTLIREALMQHKDVASFEFEMTALWKYGNEKIDHDMLDVDQHYTQACSDYIRNTFIKKSHESNRTRILDKTVSNIMRLAFIQKVLPNAKILHVIRDGRAVSASAMSRWTSKQSPSYFIRKLKTVPFRSLPFFLFKIIRSKYLSFVQGSANRQTWGSRWPGFDNDVANLPLAAVCAKQWVLQVKAALDQKKMLKPNSYFEIRYEELVDNPKKIFDDIRRFFQLDADQNYDRWVQSVVDSSRTKKWEHDLSAEELNQVLHESSDLLKCLGYIE